MTSPLRRAALAFIDTYRRDVGPKLEPVCVMVPSCSEYGRQAYVDHAFVRATWLTVGRLRTCARTRRAGG